MMANDTIRRAEPTKLAVTNADAERAVERFRRTVEENSVLRTENETLIEENAALSETLIAERANLRSVPVDGEPYRYDALYTEGMTVTVDGTEYEATHWSQDKPPGESPEHWKVKETPSYPHWDTLSGLIEKGTLCIYPDGDGKETVWECQLSHNKFSTFKPKDGSEQWERVK